MIAAIVSEFLAKHGTCLDFTEEAAKHLFDLCKGNDEGARGLIRKVERTFVGPLHEHIRKNPNKDRIRIGCIEERLFFYPCE